MRHVKQIEELFDQGDTDEAHSALDVLLEFGPSNTEALKLRARLFEYEGRFADENRIWEKISDIDNEDEDAINFMFQKQIEDRDLFYFTDDLPGGGRRYLARATKLTHTILLTTLSCMIFVLLYMQVAQLPPFFQIPATVISLFLLLALIPSVATFIMWLVTIKSVSVNREVIEFSTPIRRFSVKWEDVNRVCLARSIKNELTHLSLVILPKDRTEMAIDLNLDMNTTSVRARTHLVREISRIFGEPDYEKREDLGLNHFKLVSF